ncbi:thioredoxin domain-containing protein [Prosthecochloris sp. SCSIO W1102]|uniref:thioredoxin domain-containing protein n=1 Tax=Prosthecochloris sp. SCSIO W1102 TaxID=2992243 RepID=UPI00223DC2FB|nr:thioredoxin domain-containing protein [Prosthecochloris sp. SCSIO W1102]UZJ39531.1 thioredoxin domain-containing protein [Prosthecochloris sp. SCSIO W1102]
MPTPSKRKPNLLAKETSPYLLQHAYNPVEWYPWSDLAFEKARNEQKPIFLSVGYSTCHWCHVMERESFENDAIAEILNRSFVPVKVDREERPDIDKLYMTYVQSITGGGGWPMSVWLTSDLEPFYGGTYFPPKDRYGRPGFLSLLLSIEQAWKDDRNRLLSVAAGMSTRLETLSLHKPDEVPVDKGVFDLAAKTFAEMFDKENGGFGNAPKFPQPSILEFLLTYSYYTGNQEALEMVLFTIRKMAAGGIHDQLSIKNHGGGGFARYSTDERWHVPHFEKMLYDNAQLVVVAIEAYQITGKNLYADLADDILNYVLCDMTDNDGGFYSAEDADSFPDKTSNIKNEGAFYVWSRKEIAEVLDPLATNIFCFIYGVENNGNVLDDPHVEFTGQNILFIKNTPTVAAEKFSIPLATIDKLMVETRKKLFHARNKRPRPHLDDKILTSWNGLMISALSKASSALQNQHYLDAALKAAEFILENLYNGSEGRLLRRYCKGKAGIEGKADDYAFFIQGLLDLYEASSEYRYLSHANKLMEKQVELFFDNESGGFFNAASDDPSIPIRMKEDYDGAEPSPNSINALSLYRLADMIGREDLREIADKTIAYFSKVLNESGRTLPFMLKVTMLPWYGTRQIMLTGHRQSETMKSFENILGGMYLPDTFVVHASDSHAGNHPFLKKVTSQTAGTAAYVCAHQTCSLPVSESKSLEELLRKTKPSMKK